MSGAVNPVFSGTLSVLEKIYGAVKDHALLNSLRQTFLGDLAGLRSKDLSAIEAELVWRLSVDLNDEEVLPVRRGFRAARAVVFVDTLESLIGAELSKPDEERASSRLRDLITELRSRILFVLAGQNRLDWKFIDSDWERSEWLEQHLLGGLAEPHARDFLTRCGITDPPVQQAVLDHCLRIQNVAFHPASLGLFADICWLEIREGRTPSPALFDEVAPGDMASLMRRFLKSLSSEAEQQWIRQLARTPSFDEAAARAMHSAGWSQVQDMAWETLYGMSFLVPAPKRAGWFSIDSLIQDSLRLSGTEAPEYHQRWRAYWESRPPIEAGDLAWFHHWCLDREGARAEWTATAEKARVGLDMATHFALLDWWDPTGVVSRPPADSEDAAILVWLGRELWHCTLGDRTANLRKAISCYESALQVYTREAFPEYWARTQNNLGNVYSDMPDANRANLRQAIACYENALQIRTRAAFPEGWAMTQNNLGNAYRILPDGDRAANLRQAIACYEKALEVRTREALPGDWAATQHSLGVVYSSLPDGDRTANLRQAIAYYYGALEVHTRLALPADWAMTQINLGLAYSNLPDGDRTANVRQAITCYEEALQVYTRTAFPRDWASTQTNLGVGYSYLPGSDRAANLRHAIAFYENALEVYTRAAFPIEWARIQNNIGALCSYLPDGDRAANLRQGIACCENALQVRTRAAFPADWAATQNNLGLAYSHLPHGDLTANLRQAIACYEKALEVRTRQAFPGDWAATQHNLGLAYSHLPGGDQAVNLNIAITSYEKALEVRTRRASPGDWAVTNLLLADALNKLTDSESMDCDANVGLACEKVRLSIEVFESLGDRNYLAAAREFLAHLESRRGKPDISQ